VLDILLVVLTLATFLGCIPLAWLKPRGLLESTLLAATVGLGLLPLLLLAMRIVRLPLDVRLVAIIAAAGPILLLVKKWRPGKTGVERAICLGGALLVGAITVGVLFAGAQNYPWLEDSDPWDHAIGARYVALEKTTAQNPEHRVSTVLEPYPPYFTALMGLLLQKGGGMIETLKFGNALLIGFAVVAAFFAIAALTRDNKAGLAGAIIFAVLPASMSHFIWSQTLAIPVFLIALFAIADLREQEPLDSKRTRPDPRFALAAILIGSATIIQPSTAVIFAFLFVMFAAIHLPDFRPAKAVVAGGLISLLGWSYLFLQYGLDGVLAQIGVRHSVFTDAMLDSSGGVVYSVGDIISAPMRSNIDQAIGLGWGGALFVAVSMALLINRLRLKDRTAWFSFALILVGIVGIQGNALPVKLFPHRFWVFLAIAVALVCALGFAAVAKRIKPPWAGFAVASAFVLLVIASALPARVSMQQAIWPPGPYWMTREELDVYVQLNRHLPPGTRILSLCGGDRKSIGFGMASEPWDPALTRLRHELNITTPAELAAYLVAKDYHGVIVDHECARIAGPASTLTLANGLVAHGFVVRLQINNLMVLERP
jgi:hypothetical protein